MRTPLQEQMLKAGLVKKNKVAEAVRAQNQQRQNKAPALDGERVDAQKLQAERAERDRNLAAEQKAQARVRELRAQVRQIIETHSIARAGELPYRFVDEGGIKEILVSEAQRSQLAKGALAIARHETGYALLPRAAAEMIHERGGPIVLDHARTDTARQSDADDAYYARFVVPDDLIW